MCYFKHFKPKSIFFTGHSKKFFKSVTTKNTFYKLNVFFLNIFYEAKLAFYMTANETRNTTIFLGFSNYEPAKRANRLH